MKRALSLAIVCVFGLAVVLVAQRARHDGHLTEAELKARVHAFLERSLGWQGLDTLKIESISKPDSSGLRTVVVYLAKGDQHKSANYLISADEKEIIEGGQADELSGDPWAKNRSKLALGGAPVTGDAKAPVTIVEFSDLECPYCKEEASSLDQLMNVDPDKARVIFKFFPLTSIHPWSMPAAEAGECVAQQGSLKFWNFERGVFAAQDKITVADAKARLRDFAGEAGANLATYDACLLRPATHAAVEASIANGKALGVTSTPTMFVNGRPIPGAIPEQQLQMLVDHEAGYHVNRRVADANGAKLGGELKGQQCNTCTPLPPLPKSYQKQTTKPKTCCARP